MKWLLPPLLWLFCVLSMDGLRHLFPLDPLFSATRYYPAVGLIVIGLGMTVAVSARFRRLKTNINTFRNPDTLVTDGLFRLSRNPIYLGFMVALIGVAIAMNTLLALLLVAVFFAAAQFWYIPFEERAAEQAFGDTYREYRHAVRRWF
jgi:protein-S-isoprenylcysteine O-methyltransferase Ste14